MPGLVYIGTDATATSRSCKNLFTNLAINGNGILLGSITTSAIPTTANYSSVGVYLVVDGVGINVGFVAPSQAAITGERANVRY